MVPALVALIESTVADDSHWEIQAHSNLLRHKALMRLYELEPDQARGLLIKEIKRPGAIIVDPDLLAILPPGPLPEVDDALTKNLEAEHTFTAASLLPRFASPAIYRRVKEVYLQRAGRWDCVTGADLLAYLVRANPAHATQLVEEALDTREKTQCYRTLLGSIAQQYFEPSLEALATARLNDPDGTRHVYFVATGRRKPGSFYGADLRAGTRNGKDEATSCAPIRSPVRTPTEGKPNSKGHSARHSVVRPAGWSPTKNSIACHTCVLPTAWARLAIKKTTVACGLWSLGCPVGTASGASKSDGTASTLLRMRRRKSHSYRKEPRFCGTLGLTYLVSGAQRSRWSVKRWRRLQANWR